MRHYEIMFLVHPDKTELVPGIIEKFKTIITQEEGAVHRLEDLGRRQLAYPMFDLHKAHYVLMNVACLQKSMDELKNYIKFNDAILRHMIIKQKKAVTTESPLMKKDPRGDDRR